MKYSIKFPFLLKLVVALLYSNLTIAQTQISPKYSVDAAVSAMVTRGDTLIVAGRFNNVGIFTGGGALLTDKSDRPNLNFPKFVGDVYCSTPDGNGGYYIYGNYRRESEDPTGISIANSKRIEHILPNFSFETGFSLPVDALWGINQLLYHDGVLYIGGKYMQRIDGQTVGDLAAIDVKTRKLLSWIPKITRTYLGGVSNLKINRNILYFSGGFSDVGNEKRNSVAAIEINTGKLKAWQPTVGGINSIEFYKDKIIIGGGFGDGTFNNHACALVDSITGQNKIEYIFNSSNLYWAAGLNGMTISGDTLFTFTGGTFDTRVTAINLAKSNTIIWKKYFNSTASPYGMKVLDNSLYVVGTGFEAIYKTNLPNDNENIERVIKAAVKLDARTGNLQDWFPDPVGLIYRDAYTMSITNKNGSIVNLGIEYNL